MIDQERWVLLDRTTGRRAAPTVTFDRRHANLDVLAVRDRQRRGGRPDLSFEFCQALVAVPRAQCPPTERVEA